MNPHQVTDALRAVLLALPGHLPIEEIQRLWVFPPRELGPRESGLVVAALATPGAPAHEPHRIYTVEYDSDRHRPRPDPKLEVTEQGSAPHDRLDRVIAGVLARLGDERDDPDDHEIGGSADRWAALLREYEVAGG